MPGPDTSAVPLAAAGGGEEAKDGQTGGGEETRENKQREWIRGQAERRKTGRGEDPWRGMQSESEGETERKKSQLKPKQGAWRWKKNSYCNRSAEIQAVRDCTDSD